ncbi:Hypothetical predicted protein, partial [Paramuricea clavata]
NNYNLLLEKVIIDWDWFRKTIKNLIGGDKRITTFLKNQINTSKSIFPSPNHLFKQVDVFLKEKQVTQATGTYAHCRKNGYRKSYHGRDIFMSEPSEDGADYRVKLTDAYLKIRNPSLRHAGYLFNRLLSYGAAPKYIEAFSTLFSGYAVACSR